MSYSGTPRYPRHSQRALAEVLGAGDAGELAAVVADADGSLVGRTAWLQEILTPKVITGVTDIDDSAQTETTPFPILTIAPADGSPLFDCYVDIDLAKASTGFAAVETSVTVTFAVAHKVDGANWRRRAINEAALSGTNAAGRMQRIHVGPVSEAEGAAIFATFSSDVTADMELPFAVVYRAAVAPTVTPVAAG